LIKSNIIKVLLETILNSLKGFFINILNFYIINYKLRYYLKKRYF